MSTTKLKHDQHVYIVGCKCKCKHIIVNDAFFFILKQQDKKKKLLNKKFIFEKLSCIVKVLNSNENTKIFWCKLP